MARKNKLAYIVTAEGFDTLDHLLEAIITDSVSPAICMHADCNYMQEMEPDQDRGWCPECSTNSMKAATVLAGVI